MKVEFHPDAAEELGKAVDHYDGAEPGLGQDFALEVHAAVQRVASFPTAWPVLDGDIRRCMTNRFPYGVLFAVEPDKILILAVMHLHRHPDYWKNRLNLPGGA